MENKIKKVINETDGYIIFDTETSLKNNKDIVVQIKDGNLNSIENVTSVFDEKADILVTFDNKIINIYAKNNKKIKNYEEKYLKSFIKRLSGKIFGEMKTPTNRFNYIWYEININKRK